MANHQNEVQVSFEVDSASLERGLDDGIQKMQAGVDRLNQLGDQAAPPTPATSGVSGIGGAAPQSTPSGTSSSASDDLIGSIKAQLEDVRGMSQETPDVAMLRLIGGDGSGGLRSQINKAAIRDPDGARQYQELLNSLGDLTDSIKSASKAQSDGGADPASGLLGFMRKSALFNVASGIGQRAMGGDLVGAGAMGVGSALGFAFGGPVGAMAGSQIGSMVGGAANAVLGGADEARQYSIMAGEVAARLGDFGQEDELSIDRLGNAATAGYSTQDTLGLVDSLRQNRLIDDAGDESTLELVRSLQELSRAVGMNTDQLVAQYSSYRNQGGTGTPQEYMAQMISGAVSIGMRENLDQYSEMLSSTRTQLVYRSGMGDEGGGLQRLQETMMSLMGTDSSTAELLRDNPALAQQMLGSLVGTGAAQAYSYDSAAMQMAGVDRALTTEGFIGPAQQVENALARQQYIFNNVLSSGGVRAMGYDDAADLQAAAQQDPDLVQRLFTDRNPNTEQAAQLQDLYNIQFKSQYGRDASGQERQMGLQLMQAYLENGTLTPQTQTKDGEDIASLVEDAMQSDGERAREAQADRHRELLELLSTFAPLLTTIDRTASAILGAVNGIVDGLSFLPGFGGAQQPTVGAIAIGADGEEMEPRRQRFRSAEERAADDADERAEDVDNVLSSAAGTAARIVAPAVAGPLGALLSPTIGEHVGDGVRGLLGRVRGNNESRRTTAGSEETVEPTARTDRMRGRRTGTEEQAAAIPELEEGQIAAMPSLDPDAQSIPTMVHAAVGDTPPGGLVARPDFNIFQFQPGDRVVARQSASPVGGESFSANITVTLQVPDSANFDWVEQAARQGTGSGLDAFEERWKSRFGNKPSASGSMYG